jgi:hypothetical protein
VVRSCIVVSVFVLAALSCGRARAVVIPAKDAFGATPSTNAKTGPRSYFTFDVRPGTTVHDSFVVSNASKHIETLLVGAALGETASNSGYSYKGGFGPCHRAACWIHGLPDKVTLAAGKKRVIPFAVSVPASAPARQYLAGLVVRSARKPAATPLGSRGGVGAQAVIIPQIQIGVAITTAPLASLVRRLAILRVAPSSSGATGALVIDEHNVGDTFLSARGTALCVGGAKRFAYPVASQTILPGDRASLTVYTPGLPSGTTMRCRVTLNYAGSHATPAVWHGVIHFPALHPPKVVQTRPGVFASVPKARVPRWAIALMIGGGIIVLALIVVIVLLLRRRPPAATA